MTDQKTIDVYNAKTQDYAETVKKGGPDATLTAFIDRLPKGSRVLDLGCGLGNSSAIMAAAGLLPDPVDASAGMIAYAQKEYGLPARIGDFYDIGGIYDAVWANFSLLHMPLSEMPAYFGLLHRHLAPDGLFHLGMKIGSGEARDPIGRRYSYLTVETAEEWLHENSFDPEPPVFGETLGLDGVVAPFFTLTALARKKETA